MKGTPNLKIINFCSDKDFRFYQSSCPFPLVTDEGDFTPSFTGKKLLFILCLVISGISFQGMAQKSQTKSIAVPANIKIDGNSSDWSDQFNGYNNSTELYYSVANDDKNVYMIIRATDPLIEKKILRAGVTVSLRWHEKSKGWLKMTFPMLSESEASEIGFYLSDDNLKQIKKGEAKKSDSLTTLMNNKLRISVNKIGITGTPFILDSLISIYNDKGIRAAALFNNKAALTYEIAIPLKYLPGNSGGEIDYNIKSNGIFSHVKVVMLDPSVNPNTAGMVVIGSSITGKTSSDIQILNSDTDFSGQIELNGNK